MRKREVQALYLSAGFSDCKTSKLCIIRINSNHSTITKPNMSTNTTVGNGMFICRNNIENQNFYIQYTQP
jgi:hypothetical protein